MIGLIPGLLLIVGLGVLSTYTGYVIGQFRKAHPGIKDMGDAFEVLFTPWGFPKFGQRLGSIGMFFFMVFLMGSHILTWIICWDTITNHAMCNIWWGVIALVVFWALDLKRTLGAVSWLSIVSSISVVISVFITSMSALIVSF